MNKTIKIKKIEVEETLKSPPRGDLEGLITGSDALILSLLEEGVETIFGYPGGAIMPIYDALYNYADQVKHILSSA
ncbi:MAG: thiamine pyrophosphate-binding protein [Chitinophagaceae bacterium]